MPNELTDAQRRAIAAEIFAGGMISAITLYRSPTGLDLKDSKDAIERYEVELCKQFPDKAPAAADPSVTSFSQRNESTNCGQLRFNSLQEPPTIPVCFSRCST